MPRGIRKLNPAIHISSMLNGKRGPFYYTCIIEFPNPIRTPSDLHNLWQKVYDRSVKETRRTEPPHIISWQRLEN